MKIDLKLTYFRSGVPVDFAESQEDFDRITEGLPTVLCPRCDGMGGTSMGRCTFCFGEGEALDAGNYHYWVADGGLYIY